jgi:uncharacterized protein YbjT (DUF2867 family)
VEGSGRDRIVVAGATGFVGRALARRLRRRSEAVELVGLTRGRSSDGGDYDEFVTCDLFSLKDAEDALSGARVAVYLVHSMSRSARLVQGDFADLDLICADNFARAARKAGVEQIVYLGGILPNEPRLSRHLASRLEVEQALARHGTPLTTLRAGLVLGAGGSSSEMLVRLVRRLPALACPAWTRTPCQPIDLDTVVELLDAVIGDREAHGEIYDVAGPELSTYRELIAVTARELGVERPLVDVPAFSPRLSRLWISLVTGAPAELVAPLVESLSHAMLPRDRRLQDRLGVPGLSLREAVARALRSPELASTATPTAYTAPPSRSGVLVGVRSVQRVPMPRERDAMWAAFEYMRWLPVALRPLIRVGVDEARACSFYLGPVAAPLLVLAFSPGRSSEDRPLFYVTGGLLAAAGGRGRLEFRETPDRLNLLTAIHDFVPRLPWWIYRYTQAIAHLLVMAAFGRHLRRLAGPPTPGLSVPGDRPATKLPSA